MRAFVFIVIKEDVVTFYKAREEKKNAKCESEVVIVCKFFQKSTSQDSVTPFDF